MRGETEIIVHGNRRMKRGKMRGGKKEMTGNG